MYGCCCCWYVSPLSRNIEHKRPARECYEWCSFFRPMTTTSFFQFSSGAHSLTHSLARYVFNERINHRTETYKCQCPYISRSKIHADADTYIYLNITYYVVKVHYFSNFVLLIVRAQFFFSPLRAPWISRGPIDGKGDEHVLERSHMCPNESVKVKEGKIENEMQTQWICCAVHCVLCVLHAVAYRNLYLNTLVRERAYTKLFRPVFSFAQNL